MSDSAARETQINMQKGELTGAIEHLEKVLHLLEERLEPLLIPVNEAKGEGEVPQESLVPLASYLRSRRHHIALLIAKVDSINQRLEL